MGGTNFRKEQDVVPKDALPETYSEPTTLKGLFKEITRDWSKPDRSEVTLLDGTITVQFANLSAEDINELIQSITQSVIEYFEALESARRQGDL